MTLHERCLAYARSEFGLRFPDSIPRVSLTGRWLYGHINIGAQFKNATRYPGAYPAGYVARVRALFPDVPTSRILHLFSGSVPKGRWTRVDLKTAGPAGSGFVTPEIVGSVYDLPDLLRAHRRGPFGLILADPSYPRRGRALYGTAEINSARAMRAIAAAFPYAAHLVWLSTDVPLYRKDQWYRYGFLTIERSTGHAIRGASLFERRAA